MSVVETTQSTIVASLSRPSPSLEMFSGTLTTTQTMPVSSGALSPVWKTSSGHMLTVGEEVGSGAFGSVHAVSVDGGPLASLALVAKIVTIEAEGDRVASEKEAEFLKLLTQASAQRVVRCFDTMVCSTSRRMCYLMERCAEGDLAMVAERQYPKDIFPEALALETLRQVAVGVSELHAAGIVHGDINDENVLVDSMSPVSVKIADLNSAIRVPPGGHVVVDTVPFSGTPGWTSPEQLTLGARFDAQSDAWGLGVLLYVMVLGILPFEDDAGNDDLMNLAIIHGEYWWGEKFNRLCPVVRFLITNLLCVDASDRLTLPELLVVLTRYGPRTKSVSLWTVRSLASHRDGSTPGAALTDDNDEVEVMGESVNCTEEDDHVLVPSHAPAAAPPFPHLCLAPDLFGSGGWALGASLCVYLVMLVILEAVNFAAGAVLNSGWEAACPRLLTPVVSVLVSGLRGVEQGLMVLSLWRGVWEERQQRGGDGILEEFVSWAVEMWWLGRFGASFRVACRLCGEKMAIEETDVHPCVIMAGVGKWRG